MKDKKAQGLSLQTVIVAIILLVVLVVVIFIFTKFIGEEGDVVNESISNVADCIPGNPDSENCNLLKGLKGNDGTASGNP